jgi:hypothetical protein
MQPHVYLAYTPRGAGVAAAGFYVVDRDDVYGWFTGARGHETAAAYFALERYFSEAPSAWSESRDDDVHGPWATGAGRAAAVVPCPVPEPIRHELARLASAFVDEWLFYPEVPGAEREVESYWKLGLPVQPANIRASELNRFDRSGPAWTHASPGTDLNVVAAIARHWALDHRVPAP